MLRPVFGNRHDAIDRVPPDTRRQPLGKLCHRVTVARGFLTRERQMSRLRPDRLGAPSCQAHGDDRLGQHDPFETHP